jgi:hypothetical protein
LTGTATGGAQAVSRAAAANNGKSAPVRARSQSAVKKPAGARR